MAVYVSPLCIRMGDKMLAMLRAPTEGQTKLAGIQCGAGDTTDPTASGVIYLGESHRDQAIASGAVPVSAACFKQVLREIAGNADG